MQVQFLKVTNFRNIESGEVTFGSGINVLHGDNGSGKTNLLEAIFTLCLGRSQRAAKDSYLVRHGADYYRIQGNIKAGENKSELAVAYQLGGRKKISIDSTPARASELYERLSLVAAGPEDSGILSGPPSTRRLFIDLYLSQLKQTYLVDLTDYQKVLMQRNAALKNSMDPTPFDSLLVSYGSKIIYERNAFLQQLGESAIDHYSQISGGEQLHLQYKPKVSLEPEATTPADIETVYTEALARSRERERVMQTSLVGPHRDEIDIQISGLPARSHGSQGQWRAAAVVLKLAVYDLLEAKRGQPPILLLDEIFAELDNSRAEQLIQKFFEGGQLFLTTAVDPPQSLMENAARFKIASGQIVEAE